jgi:hypothetical protein
MRGRYPQVTQEAKTCVLQLIRFHSRSHSHLAKDETPAKTPPVVASTREVKDTDLESYNLERRWT